MGGGGVQLSSAIASVLRGGSMEDDEDEGEGGDEVDMAGAAPGEDDEYMWEVEAEEEEAERLATVAETAGFARW